MARMLDVLRQAEAKRNGDGAAPPEPDPADDDFVSEGANEEVPFIEVGPARSLEASSAVLAGGSYLYFRDMGRPGTVAGQFLHADKFAEVARARQGRRIATYELWRLDTPKRPIQGKMP
jgi:hypothetical protein